MSTDTTAAFDDLLTALQRAASAPAAPPDAITRVLAAAPRTTAVASLRDDPDIARFREDLADGLIRLDTANVVFRLIADVLNRTGGLA